MNTIETIINNIWIQRIFWSIVVILAAILIYVVFSRILSAREQKNTKIFASKKNRTFLKMLRSIARYILILLSTLVILQIFGVDVSSMLAGVGIISIIIGFAIQDALKDIIRGFDIISDTYYSVGDIIKYGELTGKVLTVGLKTTKVQDIMTNNIISIANRNIDQIAVVSGDIMLNIPLSYELPVKKAETVIAEIIKTVQDSPSVTDAQYLGLNELDSSSLNYLIKVTCAPDLKLQTRRDTLKIIMTTLESHHISVPYTQLDLHQKK